MCYYQSVEIRLYEIVLSYSINNDDDPIDRVIIRYAFLMAVKTFLSTHFSHSYPLTAARAYMTMAQSEYAIRMGIKLIRMPSTEGWDCEHVRNVLDFPSTMEMAVSKVEAILRVRSRNGEQRSRANDVFAKYLDNLKCVKDWSQSLETSSSELIACSGARLGKHNAELGREDLNLAEPEGQPFSEGFVTAVNSDNLLWDALNGQVDDWMVFGS
jgi:hypothetical protein